MILSLYSLFTGRLPKKTFLGQHTVFASMNVRPLHMQLTSWICYLRKQSKAKRVQKGETVFQGQDLC